jgi:hypothetical protein
MKIEESSTLSKIQKKLKIKSSNSRWRWFCLLDWASSTDVASEVTLIHRHRISRGTNPAKKSTRVKKDAGKIRDHASWEVVG